MPEIQRHRFTILEHDHPFLHWDLLMQQGSVLLSWRLLTRPETNRWIDAEALPDHRLLYLDYEGPVRNDRGHVRQLTTGTFSVMTDADTEIESCCPDSRTFLLFDCDLAQQACCRGYGTANPEWQFA